jgi:hypothetical protein
MDSLRRRVLAQDIRGTDAVMLEVMMSDLCEKPLGQLAPANVADLFALAAKSDAPGSIARRVAHFPKRIATEIADLPNGSEFLAAIEELKAVPSDRVPHGLRQVWAGEMDKPKRTATERAAVQALVEHWGDSEPTPFEIAAPAAPTTARAAAAASRERPVVRNLPMAPPQHREERAPRAASAAPRPAPRPKPDEDPAKKAWLREIILDRLVEAHERGLLEAVITGAVCHRARDIYPNLGKAEVIGILRDLEKRGEVRHTAGRYIRTLGKR